MVSFIAVVILWKENVRDEDGKKENLVSPLEGKLIPLSEVGDDVFSNKLMGDGFAVIPSKGELYAPIDGTIEMIFETKHSLAMKSNDGTEIMFHIGLETVNLNGKYFDPKVLVGARVKQGDLLMNFDLDGIVKEGFNR